MPITEESKFNVVFLWPELPDYAARCLGALRQSSAEFNVHVVATKPKVPIIGMESSFGRTIIWLDGKAPASWRDLGLDVPDVLFVGGYSNIHFKRLELEARKSSAKIVLMSDNAWNASLKQVLIEPIRHKLLYRWRYDYVLVPGWAGAKLARRWGYSPEQIVTGMYGADISLFYPSCELFKRDKSIVFIGQLIERKNIKLLCEAFLVVCEKIPEWSLEVYGEGALADVLPRHPMISYNGFNQPAELASALRNARYLVLLSSSEHWGLVVHEAALSGCALLLSDKIGARHDLATDDNSIVCFSNTMEEVCNALLEFDKWSEHQWRKAQDCSIELSQKFGPQAFVDSIRGILDQAKK